MARGCFRYILGKAFRETLGDVTVGSWPGQEVFAQVPQGRLGSSARLQSEDWKIAMENRNV